MTDKQKKRKKVSKNYVISEVAVTHKMAYCLIV